MAGTTLDLENIITPNSLATSIAGKYDEWNNLRTPWLEQQAELRNYVFATDTKTTTNSALPWVNSTTTPKLTQIYDNLKANYTAALFPNSHWMRWEGDTSDAVVKITRQIIQAYMEAKVYQSGFETTADRLIDDYILYGNCFATVEYVKEIIEDEATGQGTVGYAGPRVVRISPNDIVFNPLAANFSNSPKIIRSVLSLGEVQKLIDNGDTQYSGVFDSVMNNRKAVNGARPSDVRKSEGFIADGFSDISSYYGSGYCEVLTFYGDIYDSIAGEVKVNRKIVIIDRAYVIEDEQNPSWLGESPVYHAGWRSRPDNLYAMGPLDNLVGMQYRIDHLENLKADVFDQIALPILKIRGDVEEFTYAPGTKIVMGEEGDVSPMSPDGTALQADFQIQLLESKMEEMAGAPRQAMGIRTPGEKTAFEVQSLQNAAGRIFQHKAAKLEKEFIEPILNAMLEAGRRNLDTADSIRILDDQGTQVFKAITRADIAAKGKIKPVGARHFAERATRVQNINQMLQIKAGDPTVGVHMSGKAIAQLLTEELGEKDIYGDNIQLTEQAETQRAAQDIEAQVMEEQQIQAEGSL